MGEQWIVLLALALVSDVELDAADLILDLAFFILHKKD